MELSRKSTEKAISYSIGDRNEGWYENAIFTYGELPSPLHSLEQCFQTNRKSWVDSAVLSMVCSWLITLGGIFSVRVIDFADHQVVPMYLRAFGGLTYIVGHDIQWVIFSMIFTFWKRYNPRRWNDFYGHGSTDFDVNNGSVLMRKRNELMRERKISSPIFQTSNIGKMFLSRNRVMILSILYNYYFLMVQTLISSIFWTKPLELMKKWSSNVYCSVYTVMGGRTH